MLREVEPIKAIAKGIKGKSYLAIFEEIKKRPVTKVVLTELDSGASEVGQPFDPERGVEGKSVELGGRRINKKKKKTKQDTPIKAKWKGIKGKKYRATFSTREVS